MELEAKLAIKDLNDLNKVAASLTQADPNYTTETQEDIFFDGPDGELEAHGATMRLRCTTGSQGQRKYKATLKEQSDVSEGSSLRWEHEDGLTPEQAQTFVADPISFLQATGIVTAQALREKFGLQRLMRIGEISTKRMTFKWGNCSSQPGLTIRADQTTFPFGDRFELEVPHITVPVHDVLDELNRVLTGLGVQATLAKESKFQQLRSGVRAAAAKSHMVVEAKVELASEKDYEVVRNSLLPNAQTSAEHENWFFDSEDNALSRRGAMCRVRIDRAKGLCVATIKEHADVTDGSSLCWAQEEAIPLGIGERLKQNPATFFDSSLENNNVVQSLKSKYGMTSLSFVGGFSTNRQTFLWAACQSQPGLTLRLDKTTYPFGTKYEIEVPHIRVPVEDVVHELTGVLQGLGVTFQMGTGSKFQQFRAGMAKSFMSAASS